MKNETSFKPLSRRNFLYLGFLGAGTMVAVTLAGKVSAQSLGGEVGPISSSDLLLSADKKLISTISRNHGHVFTISLTDLQKNGAKTYNIKGSASHSHEIEISNEVLTALVTKNIVEIESTDGAGHTHIVRLEIL